MARGKKTKTGGKYKAGSIRKSPQTSRFADVDRHDDGGFTLRDAANRRGAELTPFGSMSNLRHKTMSFVSSIDTRADQDDTRTKEADDETARHLYVDPVVTRVAPNSDNLSSQVSELQIVAAAKRADEASVSRVPLNAYLTNAGDGVDIESEDDIVLFSGRSGYSTSTTIIPDELEGNNTIPASRPVAPLFQMSPPSLDIAASCASPITASNTATRTKQKNGQTDRKQRQKGRSTERRNKNDSEDDLQAVLDDYVENMRGTGEIDDFTTAYEALARGKARCSHSDSGWDSVELEDLDDLSTSDELLGDVEFILSRRERPSGLQYLVSWEGQSMDEARWILHTNLQTDDVKALIFDFEEQERLVAEYPQDDEEDEDSDVVRLSEGSDNGDDSEEAFEDERDLLERKMARMTDEKIARLLAKQEELGMGSNQLMLFDASDGDEDEIAMKVEDELDADFISLGSKPRNNAWGKRQRRKLRGTIMSDPTDMLDTHEDDDFDIMDRTRPSLGLGRRGKDIMTFGLSDSELENELRDTFAADRKKKKAKKLEREELRAAGLLGKKSKTRADIDAKYSTGIGIDQIKFELENFLLNDLDTCALPPMDKRDRKFVHDISQVFGLKSKSAGKGRARYPVLYKTARSRRDFDADLFESLQLRAKRPFFSRMDKRGGGKSLPPKRTGGVNGTQFGYREGEIVGATAPELGADNRGRVLLEKMGWSIGTGLGSINNRGILMPVEHVVKNSKRGLG